MDWGEVVARRRRESEAQLVQANSGADAGEWKLRRFAACDLTCRAARALVREGQPFVVTGLDLAPCEGDALSFLRRTVGQRQVPVETGQGGKESEVMSVEQLLRRVEQGEGLYMYDVPIAKRLGALRDAWMLPAYFCRHEYLKKTRLEHAFRNWPTLFIGAEKTRSATHVDRWQGNFWMFQIHGRKQWTIWRPSDLCKLSPVWTDKFDPSFPPVEELHNVGDPIVLTLQPGELLFVPGGAPHAVINIDLTVAMAGNFVDDSNVKRVLSELEQTQLRYADDRGLFEALSEMDFDEEEQDDDNEEKTMEM